MIITNSTPDNYYFEQLLAFLASIKINSPKHSVTVFLANYPKDKKRLLCAAFEEFKFENAPLKMIDERGFSLILDRAARIKECFEKYKESVTWIDTDTLVRSDLSEFIDIGPKQIKILYRKDKRPRYRINAGVFNIGYSEETYAFICDWYSRIKANAEWGRGQLEFWNVYKEHENDVEMIKMSSRFNNMVFHNRAVIWHCKKCGFNKPKYQREYREYLSRGRRLLGV